MKKYIKVFIYLLKFSLMDLIVYRWDLLFRNIGFALESWVIILFFKVLYFNIPEINGWRYRDLLLIVAAYNILEWLLYFFYEHNHRRLHQKVNRGELDNLLTKPLDAQVIISFKDINFQSFAGLFVGIFIIFYVLKDPYTMVQLFSFILLFMVGAIIHYAISLMIATISFFTPKMEDFRHIEGRFRDLAFYPVDIYPPILKFVFKTFLPIAFFTTVPAQAFSNPSPQLFVEAFMVAGIFLFLSRKFFLTGLKRYSSASS